MSKTTGGNPCSTSLRSPEPQSVSALPGNDQGRERTPGPWELHQYGTSYYNGPEDVGDPYVITAPNDGVVLAVVVPDAIPQVAANARLIVAALELEAVVAKFVEHCTFDTLGKGDNLDSLFAAAKAALAKAEVSNGNEA